MSYFDRMRAGVEQIRKDSAASKKAWQTRQGGAATSGGTAPAKIKEGDTLTATVNGKKMKVRVVGTPDSDPNTRLWVVNVKNPDKEMFITRNQIVKDEEGEDEQDNTEQGTEQTTVQKDSEASKKAWATRRAGSAGAGAGSVGSKPVGGAGGGKTPIDPATFKRTVNRIAKLTDENFHTLSSAKAAEMLGRADLKKELLQLEKTHIKIGYLSPQLAAKRQALHEAVMATALAKLPSDQYKALLGAF